MKIGSKSPSLNPQIGQPFGSEAIQNILSTILVVLLLAHLIKTSKKIIFLISCWIANDELAVSLENRFSLSKNLVTILQFFYATDI